MNNSFSVLSLQARTFLLVPANRPNIYRGSCHKEFSTEPYRFQSQRFDRNQSSVKPTQDSCHVRS